MPQLCTERCISSSLRFNLGFRIRGRVKLKPFPCVRSLEPCKEFCVFILNNIYQENIWRTFRPVRVKVLENNDNTVQKHIQCAAEVHRLWRWFTNTSNHESGAILYYCYISTHSRVFAFLTFMYRGMLYFGRRRKSLKLIMVIHGHKNVYAAVLLLLIEKT